MPTPDDQSEPSAVSDAAANSGPRHETVREFADSFFYGSRSNLDFKFLADLDDGEVTGFFDALLRSLGRTIDDGDGDRLVELALRWQQRAYSAHRGAERSFDYDDVPLSTLRVPLADATVALLTSSGHFVDGDDPRPFGVNDMSQSEAEARVSEFLRAAPTLSRIPVDTTSDRIRVRHGGYPVQAALVDHNVTMPLRPLRELQRSGLFKSLAPDAWSFVGATSQVRLRNDVAARWAEDLIAAGVDAVLLVPV